MNSKELYGICIQAIEEVLNCTADGLINGGDGTEETAKEIEKTLKDYEKAEKELQKLLEEKKTITIDLIDDGNKVGQVKSELSYDDTKKKVKALCEKWYEEDEGYCLLDYLIENCPENMEIVNTIENPYIEI